MEFAENYKEKSNLEEKIYYIRKSLKLCEIYAKIFRNSLKSEKLKNRNIYDLQSKFQVCLAILYFQRIFEKI